MRFLGVEEDRGVALQLDSDDSNITISHSEFSRCQHGLACILAQGRGLTVNGCQWYQCTCCTCFGGEIAGARVACAIGAHSSAAATPASVLVTT